MAKKLYLIMTPIISGVGGSQIYALNKIRYLKRKGYITTLFHANIGKDLNIKELVKYASNYSDQFKFPSFYYSKNEQRFALDKILRFIYDLNVDEVIVESHSIDVATWAELLSQILDEKRIKAKHIVYLLSEHPYIKTRGIFDFLKFKYDRKELAGITNKSLCYLFAGWENINEDKCYYLKAKCSNVLDDVDSLIDIDIDKFDYIIASIGRLEKPFLEKAIKDVIEFAEIYSEKNFLLLLIGGGDKKLEKKYVSMTKNIDNLSIVITGNLYPIPLSLVKIPNVFFSIAGACNVSAFVGKITISFDAKDLHPIGIYKVTTDNTIYRSPEEPKQDLKDLLKKILIDKVVIENKINIDMYSLNKVDFSQHLDFIHKSIDNLSFYNINEIKKTKKEHLMLLCIRIFGSDLFFKIKGLIATFISKY